MFVLPENLDALTAEELQALIDEGLDAFRALGITEDSPEDTIVEGERLAPIITQLRAAQKTLETSSAADRAARAARAQALNTTIVETPAAETPPAEPPPAAEPPAATEPPAVEVTPEPIQGELVTAAGNSPARRAAANGQPPAVPQRRTEVASLVAAADVPGIPTGAPLDGLTAAATAVINRMKGFPTTRVGGADGVRQQYGAALIRKGGYGELTQDAMPNDDHALVWEAGREGRLPGGSLVAAGGWCAPSETLYDLCQYETVEGILSIPEFGVTRGGIRWTQGPDFSDIYAACGFFLTETDAINDTFSKDCCMVECPPFEEIRLDAIGLCVKTPLLTNSQYPELVRRFMEGALVAQQHKVNKYVIDSIVSAAGPPVRYPDQESLMVTLSLIELAAIGMRYRYRMSLNQSVEIVAPFWFQALLHMDLGLRQIAPDNVPAWLSSWFTQRNISIQWVYDFQDLQVNGCDVEIPATVELLMYPAGTWLKGTADVINIDAVYDSTGLSQNVFTALFIEEGILAVQKCTHTCAIEIPICVSGRTAAANLFAGDGTPGSAGCFSFDMVQSVTSTGATAAGAWTPAGSEAPTSYEDLRDATPAIVASPATTWTTGQSVQTENGDRAHWHATNGWVEGVAP